jgi:hypothetical protein
MLRKYNILLVDPKIPKCYTMGIVFNKELTMSRKHFITLAREISYISDETARKLAALAVANAAGQHNSNFDRARFYTACGV